MARSNYTGIDWSQPTELLGGRKVNHEPFKPKQAHYKPTLASIRRNPNAKRGNKVTRDLAHPVDILSLFPHEDYENADDETLVQRLLGTTVRDLQAATGNPDATRSSSRSQEAVRLLHALLGGVGAPTGTLTQKQAQLAKNEAVKEALAAAAEGAAEADPSMAPLLEAAADELDNEIDDVTNLTDGNMPENEDEFVDAIQSTDAVNDSLEQAKNTQLPEGSDDEQDAQSTFYEDSNDLLNEAESTKTPKRNLSKAFSNAATTALPVSSTPAASVSTPDSFLSPYDTDSPRPTTVSQLEKAINEIQLVITDAKPNGYKIAFKSNGDFQYKDDIGNVVNEAKYIAGSGLAKDALRSFYKIKQQRGNFKRELVELRQAEHAMAADASSPRKTRSKAQK